MGQEFALGLKGYAGQLKWLTYASDQLFVLAALDWEGNEVSECVMQCNINSWKKNGKWMEKVYTSKPRIIT